MCACHVSRACSLGGACLRVVALVAVVPRGTAGGKRRQVGQRSHPPTWWLSQMRTAAPAGAGAGVAGMQEESLLPRPIGAGSCCTVQGRAALKALPPPGLLCPLPHVRRRCTPLSPKGDALARSARRSLLPSSCPWPRQLLTSLLVERVCSQPLPNDCGVLLAAVRLERPRPGAAGPPEPPQQVRCRPGHGAEDGISQGLGFATLLHPPLASAGGRRRGAPASRGWGEAEGGEGRGVGRLLPGG